MRTTTRPLIVAALAATALIAAGCSNNGNPIASFQPEVINNADAFQFQITHASNVSTTLNYSWANSGARATINNSTSLTGGSANLTLLDATGQQVYAGPLLASGTNQSAVGAPGVWTVQISFSHYDGSANFRVQKL
jgi:hypothetical protein